MTIPPALTNPPAQLRAGAAAATTPPSPPPTQEEVRAELAAAILKHVPDEKFAAVFSTLPPAAQRRISRMFLPRPVRTTVKIIRNRK